MESAIRSLFQVYYSHADYFLKEPVSYSHLNIVLKKKTKKTKKQLSSYSICHLLLSLNFFLIKTLNFRTVLGSLQT